MFDKNRINMEQSIGGNCIRVECLKEEKIDYTALKVIQNDPPEFLLKLRQRLLTRRLLQKYYLMKLLDKSLKLER